MGLTGRSGRQARLQANKKNSKEGNTINYIVKWFWPRLTAWFRHQAPRTHDMSSQPKTHVAINIFQKPNVYSPAKPAHMLTTICKTHSQNIEIMSKTNAQHIQDIWNIIHFYKALYSMYIDISKTYVFKIKLRFSIYPPYTHHFSFTCCVVVFSPLWLPVGVCSPGGGLPLLLCFLLSSPRCVSTALACTSLDLARLLGSFAAVAGPRFGSSPPVCRLNPVDCSASADIAIIYPPFLLSIPGFASSLLGPRFLEILRRLRAHDMCSQLNTWEELGTHLMCFAVVGQRNLLCFFWFHPCAAVVLEHVTWSYATKDVT